MHQQLKLNGGLAIASIFGLVIFSALVGAYLVIFTGGAGAPHSVHAWRLCSDLTCMIDWADHWQVMLTGVGAIAAAAASVYFLRKQISSGEEQEAIRRSSRLAAARARLPLFLGQISSYASNMLVMLKACLDTVGSLEGVTTAIVGTRPPPPEQAIDALAALVEATDDPLFAGLIANLISEIQILDARTANLQGLHGKVGSLSLQPYILNAAKVYAYAASMYDYARRETDVGPHRLDWDAIESALLLNQLYDDAYPGLHEFVQRRRESATTHT